MGQRRFRNSLPSRRTGEWCTRIIASNPAGLRNPFKNWNWVVNRQRSRSGSV